jgi:anthranilate phosphoribosyltransferase
MDEVSLGAATMVGELKDGRISEYEIHPEDFGLAMAATRNLRVADAQESRTVLLGVLDNEPGPARDIVLLNAGVALYTANLVDSIGAGISRAREVIASGAARARLDQFVQYTQRFGAAQ